MKFKALIASVTSVFALTCSAGDPTHEPNMTPAPEPTTRQLGAIHYLLGNSDERLFIDGFSYTGDLKAKKSDDEFSAGGDQDSLSQANKTALEFGHAFFRGEVDYPCSVTIKLRRYNPENQTFITSAEATRLSLSLNSSYHDRVCQPPKRPNSSYLQQLTFNDWDFFAGISLPPNLAKQLVDFAGEGRTLTLQFNFRVSPGARDRYQKDDSQPLEGYVRNFRLVGPNGNPLPEEIGKTLIVGRYKRTASESEFARKFGSRLWYHESELIYFAPSGSVLFGYYNAKASAQAQISQFAESRGSRWYIVQNKLFYQRNYDDIFEAFEVDPEGQFRIKGVPHKLEPHLVLVGESIKWMTVSEAAAFRGTVYEEPDSAGSTASALPSEFTSSGDSSSSATGTSGATLSAPARATPVSNKPAEPTTSKVQERKSNDQEKPTKAAAGVRKVPRVLRNSRVVYGKNPSTGLLVTAAKLGSVSETGGTRSDKLKTTADALSDLTGATKPTTKQEYDTMIAQLEEAARALANPVLSSLPPLPDDNETYHFEDGQWTKLEPVAYNLKQSIGDMLSGSGKLLRPAEVPTPKALKTSTPVFCFADPGMDSAPCVSSLDPAAKQPALYLEKVVPGGAWLRRSDWATVRLSRTDDGLSVIEVVEPLEPGIYTLCFSAGMNPKKKTQSVYEFSIDGTAKPDRIVLSNR